MKSDETKWNKRYASGKYPTEPHDAVVAHYSRAKGRQALDIAAGNGRNSIFLAKNGFTVDAVDISSTGLALIENQQLPAINTFQTDLESFQPSADKYDLVININFLLRRLFPFMKTSLKKNGILIFQTFMDPRLTGARFESRKAHQYLHPNELLHAFISLHVHLYEEKQVRFSNGEILMAALIVAEKKY